MRTPRLPRVRGGRLVRKEGGTGTRTQTVASGQCRLGRRPSRAPAGAPTCLAAASHQPQRAQTSGHVPPSPRRPQLKAPCELGTPFQLSRVYPPPAARALGKPGPVALISNQTRAPSQAPPWWEPGRGRRRAACTWPPPAAAPSPRPPPGPRPKSRPGPPRPSALPAGRERRPVPPRIPSLDGQPPISAAPPANRPLAPFPGLRPLPLRRRPAHCPIHRQHRVHAARPWATSSGRTGLLPDEPSASPTVPPARVPGLAASLPTLPPACPPRARKLLTEHMTSRSLTSVPDTT